MGEGDSSHANGTPHYPAAVAPSSQPHALPHGTRPPEKSLSAAGFLDRLSSKAGSADSLTFGRTAGGAVYMKTWRLYAEYRYLWAPFSLYSHVRTHIYSQSSYFSLCTFLYLSQSYFFFQYSVCLPAPLLRHWMSWCASIYQKFNHHNWTLGPWAL